VEDNYKTYYGIYTHYLSNDYTLNYNDSSDLYQLTQLCPGKDGACINQARAFYNAVYKFPQRYPNNCEEAGERKINSATTLNSPNSWNVNIFPNPAATCLSVGTNVKSEMINVSISDLSGRTILTKSVKTENFIATLDLNLINGAYIISVKNTKNETVTKKLLITR
jgi:hypothetical protein